jgi:hypothetical protein
LSEIQKGLAFGVKVTPQAFCRTGSVFGATPGISEVKFVTTYRFGRTNPSAPSSARAGELVPRQIAMSETDARLRLANFMVFVLP